MPSCSIIIVTYNGWELLRECLEALSTELRPGVDLTVVDNGSEAGFTDRVRHQFPWVNVVEAGTNLGFAAGNNLGIQQTSGEFVLLLNSDVVVAPGFVDVLLRPFASNPRLGSAAGTMVFRTNPELIASAGIEVFSNGLAIDRGIGCRAVNRSDDVPVFGASAGAAAYRREALTDAGLFPESFFMYLEDVDLAWRLRLRGWDAVVASGAVAEHAYSASSIEGSPFKRRLLARNRVWYMVRCLPSWMVRHSIWRIAAYDLMVMASAPVRRDMASLTGRFNAASGLRQRLRERGEIQMRTTATRAEIERWLRPAPSPIGMMRQRKATRAAAASQSTSRRD